MLTVSLILSVAALICAILSALGKAPLWVAVVLLSIIHLVTSIPFK